jgi:tubby-related protein 1
MQSLGGIPAGPEPIFPGPGQSRNGLSRADTLEPNDEGAEANVVPMVLELEEEKEQSGNDVHAVLAAHGLSGVYDPSPQTQSSIPRPMAARPPSSIDLASLSPEQLMHFLVNPVPKEMGILECRIIRDRGGLAKFHPKYTLATETGVHLLSSKKRAHNKTSNYAIMMDSNANFDKDDDGYLAKLRSNFVGSEFSLFGRGLNPSKVKNAEIGQAIASVRPELAVIMYMSTLWGKKPRGPRKMQVVVPFVTSRGDVVESRPLTDDGGLMTIARALPPRPDGPAARHPTPNPSRDTCELFHNKPPKWNDTIGAFVLNFNKRVTMASVKNFQLVGNDDPDVVFLQFGRAGKEVFTMDVRYPMSVVQAFGICLSSFDYKLCCE